ncbi:MAG: hypothetical protein OIF51_17095 [Cellvibrionaceae bacterium]|nr:hypothetical protein [Cellvibrionaceae bacterium]
MIIRNIFFLLLLLSGIAQAYEFEDGSIEIPEGFEGPITQNMGQGVSSTAFSFLHGEAGGTLLQITTWNPGQKFPNMPKEELKDGSAQYLLQFLGGIERKRENFERGKVEFVEVSDHPLAKVNWKGNVMGKSVHGTMYCFIYNSKIYSFHTQDLASFNKKYTNLAVKAFESMQLKR